MKYEPWPGATEANQACRVTCFFFLFISTSSTESFTCVVETTEPETTYLHTHTHTCARTNHARLPLVTQNQIVYEPEESWLGFAWFGRLEVSEYACVCVCVCAFHISSPAGQQWQNEYFLVLSREEGLDRQDDQLPTECGFDGCRSSGQVKSNAGMFHFVEGFGAFFLHRQRKMLWGWKLINFALWNIVHWIKCGRIGLKQRNWNVLKCSPFQT